MHSVSGDMTLTSMSPNKNATLDSTSGDVTLYMPENAQFRLNAASTSGNVNCDFLITLATGASEHNIAGAVGSGRNLIAVRTISGDINIRKTQAVRR